MSTERVIRHQQCLSSRLDVKRMNYHFKYSFVLLLFNIHKKPIHILLTVYMKPSADVQFPATVPAVALPEG